MNSRWLVRLQLSLVCLGAAAWTWAAAAAMKSVIVPMTIPPAPDGERFLFLLDISSGMESLQAANETTVFELIQSGVGGYMRAGDTYGIWTFNKETQTDKLGMQVWDPRRSRQLATIAAAAVNNVVYDQSCNVKHMMQTLGTVVHAVSNVTVFVITDGNTDMSGTPFDKTINAEYRKQKALRKQVKHPYITTLLVRDGWFVKGLVRIAGQMIELPERPQPLLLAQTNSTARATSSVASAKSAASSPPLAAASPPSVKVMKIFATPPPAPAPPVAPSETGNAELAQNIATQPTNPPGTTPAPTGGASLSATGVVANERSASAQAIGTVAQTHAPTPAPLASAPPPIPMAPTTAMFSTATPAAIPKPPIAHPISTASTPATPPEPTVRAPGLLQKLVPDSVPLVVSARERTDTSATSALDGSNPAPSPASASGSSAVQAIVPAPLSVANSAGWMLAFGAGLLAVASMLLVLVSRKSRSHSEGSFITQSMNRR
jgi:hypothetical protein